MSDRSSSEMPRSRLWLVLSLAAVAALGTVLLRLHPPMYNFTPIGALCLFLGARVRSLWAFAIPVAIMLLTDYLLWQSQPMRPFLHHNTLWVYGSLALMYFMGWLFLGRNNPIGIIATAIAGGLPFFLITNFGSWYSVAISHTVTPTALDNYSPDLMGLLECYASALPFHRGTVLGDLVFSIALFGCYALATNWLDARQPAAEAVTQGE
jgi:hypothetical protein